VFDSIVDIDARAGVYDFFQFGEELINLSQPIRVVLNGKEVYNARASAHWQALATSCVAFGDPLRLFPIALELSY